MPLDQGKPRALGRAAAALLAVLLGAAAPADSPVNVPEPADLYTGPQHGYTPQTLKGAQVIDLPALDRLLAEAQGAGKGEEDRPVLIDVAQADRKPDGLPPGTRWFPTHRSIPGAVWLPEAGAAPLSEAQERAFLDRVAALAGGDRNRPVVTFCHPECWGSWNAGKRLVAAGYTRVHWFPLGIEGWQDAHETTVLKPDRAWTAVSGETQR